MQQATQALVTLVERTSVHLSSFISVFDGKQLMVDTGFIRLRSGAYRTAFTHKDYPDVVFKYDKHQQANLSESEVWDASTPEQRKFLAELVYISENAHLLVMERIQYLADDEECSVTWAVRDSMERRILKAWKTPGTYNFAPFAGDLHVWNWGIGFDGRPKVIDYQTAG